jgi:hypothetical protein
LTSFIASLRLESLVALNVFAQNVLASLFLCLPDRPLSLLNLCALVSVAQFHIVDTPAAFFFLLLAVLLGGEGLSFQLLQLSLSLFVLFFFELLYSFFSFLL